MSGRVTGGVKRVVDLVVGGVALLVAALPMAVIAALVRWKLGSPVLFRQARAGWRERPFRIVKFRTMTDARGPDGALLPDEERLTPLGRFLRASSLDELPELWNVVRGDMSLVGPRPLPLAYLDRYTPTERRRHEVRPGLTGWAQVQGRNAVDWDERLALDVWYVEHRSAALDVRIVARTVWSVLTRQGIAHPGAATMHELRPSASPVAP
jgi:lipopolysaccharide/colanic/teichoic acid biosynthesis glycosyltransferase